MTPLIVRLGLSVCLTVLVASSAFAESERQVSKDAALARELFEFSGLDPVVESLDEAVLEGFAQQGDRIPEALLQKMRHAARRAFAPEPLRRQILQRIQAQIDTRKAKRTLTWLRTPLGRRITAMEMAAATPEGMARHHQREAAQATRERVMLVKQLNEAIDLNAATEKIMVGTALAVASAASAYDDSPVSLSQLENAIRQEIAPMMGAMEEAHLANGLFTYRELSDADLYAYVSFLRSAPGKWYTKVTIDALSAAMVSASLDLGAEIGSGFENHPAQRAL